MPAHLELTHVHIAATWALVGLIWVVQLVQYPGFAHLGARELSAYHQAHCRRITWVVAPLMGVELVTGVVLLADPPAGTSAALLVGAALMGVNWVCTAAVSMPLHGRLVGPDRERVQASLVRTNWIRTAAWTARGVIVLTLLG